MYIGLLSNIGGCLSVGMGSQNMGLWGSYLEGQGDLASRFITGLTRITI